MSESRAAQPGERRAGDWFVHVGVDQSELESTTSASLKHVLKSAAAVGMGHRMPLEYRGREQKAGNNNFPFSSHDNRHDICNAAEYFDLGMGLRKLDPEKQRRSSHNIFEWTAPSGLRGSDGFLTVYQTSFATERCPADHQGCCCRRYPKHHTHKRCSDKAAPEDEKALQPYKPS